MLNTKPWLTLGEASRYIGVSPSTLRYWADQGVIPCTRTPGGHRRFSPEDVKELKRRLGVASAAPAPVSGHESALIHTREALNQRAIQHAPWAQRLSIEARQTYREYGRELLALAVQYLARRNGNDERLREAARIAFEMGRICARVGMSSAQAVEAFWFCCHAIEDVLVPMDPERAPVDEEHLRLHRELTHFFHTLMRATMEGFDAGHPA